MQEHSSVYAIFDCNWLLELKLDDRNWQGQYQIRYFYQKSLCFTK